MTKEGEEMIKKMAQSACADAGIKREILTFVSENGGGCVDKIDGVYERRAAVMIFDCLKEEGLVFSTVTQNGLEYLLTDAGRAALRAQ